MRVEVEVRGAEEFAKGLLTTAKQQRYAVAGALRQSILAVQAAERASVAAKFKVRPRSAKFVMRNAAVIKPFPSVANLWTMVSVGQRDRFLLGTFEKGGTRTPFTPGARNIAVPKVGGARPDPSASIPDALTYKRLGMQKRGQSYKGKRGSYVVPNVGVFQRDKGEKASRLLYGFTPRLSIDKRLSFVETAQRVAHATFPPAMDALLAQSVSRNVGKSVTMLGRLALASSFAPRKSSLKLNDDGGD